MFSKDTVFKKEFSKNFLVWSRVARWYIFSDQKYQFGTILEGLAQEAIAKCWSVSRLLGILYLVYFVEIWYIFPSLGMLHQGNSGNPGLETISANVPSCRTTAVPTVNAIGCYVQTTMVTR
jgi:hypothetical protein